MVASAFVLAPVSEAVPSSAGPDLPVLGPEVSGLVERGRAVFHEGGRPVAAALPAGTTSVGVTWIGPTAGVAVRSHGPAGWTEWVHLADEADHGDDGTRPAGARAAGPVWVGSAADAIEVRPDGDVEGLAVRVSGWSGDQPAQQRALLPTASRSPVLRRAAWGSPGWSHANCPEGPELTRPVEAVIVHHTATTTSYGPDDVDDILRSIHRFHTRTRGWCDIAYQFLVDRFGRIWEGRSGGIAFAVDGGHARGFNEATTGISLIGDFDHSDVPVAALDAVGLLAGWKAAINDFPVDGTVRRVSGGSTSIPAGRAVDLPRIAAHRHVGATSCPGGHGFTRLGAVRAVANGYPASAAFGFGRAGDVPLVGDWDGDGSDDAVLFRAGAFHFRRGLRAGETDRVVAFGPRHAQPVLGDWDGSGDATVGVWDGRRFQLLDVNRSPGLLSGLPPALGGIRTVTPAVPRDFPVGRAVPLSGDWDGDGVDTLGLAADGDVVLFGDAAAQQVATRLRLGRAGDRIVVADEEQDGVDEVGLVRDGVLYLAPTGHPGAVRAVHRLTSGAIPFVVDAAGLGLPSLLTVRDGWWDPTTPPGL